jgi:hypothetical protein
MKKIFFPVLLILSCSLVLLGCAGKHISTLDPGVDLRSYKKVHIVYNHNSKKIKNSVALVPGGATYSPVGEEVVSRVGYTAQVIQSELGKYGIHSAVVNESHPIPDDVDLVVRYDDTWNWDMKDYLYALEIEFIDNGSGKVVAKGTFTSSYAHNFPTPEKEVPKMIKSMFDKLKGVM